MPIDNASTVPPPVIAGGLVVYLDYDGVLHPEDVRLDHKRRPYVASPSGHQLFEHADLLAEALSPYPAIRIVLSTSWVRVFSSVSKAAKRLPEELRSRVVGATYHRAMDRELFRQAPRGMQIWADVLRRQPTDWLAIDDDYLHWPAWCRDKLVRTDELQGISEPTVFAELTTKLAKMGGRTELP